MDGMGNRVFHQGISIKFVDGQYETTDEREIEAIKRLDTYGTEIFSSDGGTEASPEAIKRLNTERQAVPDPTGCPKCSFKAKNKIGLYSHIRSKHDNQVSDSPAEPNKVQVDDLLPPRGE